MDESSSEGLAETTLSTDEWMLAWRQKFVYGLKPWQKSSLVGDLDTVKEDCLELAEYATTDSLWSTWTIIMLSKMSSSYCQCKPLTEGAIRDAWNFHQLTTTRSHKRLNNESTILLQTAFSNVMLDGLEASGSPSRDNIGRVIDELQQGIDLEVKDQSCKIAARKCLQRAAHLAFLHFQGDGDLKGLISAMKSRLIDLKPKDLEEPSQICLRHNQDLAAQLLMLYTRTGNMDYLVEALPHAYSGIAGTDLLAHADGWITTASILSNLGRQKSCVADFDAAIVIWQDLRSRLSVNQHNKELIRVCDKFLWCLSSRYDLTGNIDTLLKAIEIAEQSMPLFKVVMDDITQGWIAHRLLLLYTKKYYRSKAFKDAEAGLEHAQTSLRLHASNIESMSGHRTQLALLYKAMFKVTHDRSYMDKAITESRLAAQLNPKSTPALHGLANHLLIRHKLTDAKEDLSEAISLIETILGAGDMYPMLKCSVWLSAGEAYRLKHEALKDIDDAGAAQYSSKAIIFFSKSARGPGNDPTTRIEASRLAARVLASQNAWMAAHEILHQAMDLIPTILPIHMKYVDRRPILESITGLAAEACSAAINCGNTKCAIEDLERGRAIVIASGHKATHDIEKLERLQPRLFKEYCNLRDGLLIDPLTNFRSLPDDFQDTELGQGSRLIPNFHSLQEQMQETLVKIRNTPGLDQFLLPMKAAEMQTLCGRNTVVALNWSPYGAHAILVQTNRIWSISLPPIPFESPTRDKLEVMVTIFERATYRQTEKPGGQKQQASILGLLSALWHHIAEPVTTELGWLYADFPACHDELVEFALTRRILWLPTGRYSRLPIHAAGEHLKSHHNNMILGRLVISTYITSFGMLRYTQSISRNTRKQSNRGLFLSMEPPPGQERNRPFLRSATRETALTISETPSIDWTVLKQPSRSQVLSPISTCLYLHITCHGISNTEDPVLSHLLLATEPDSKTPSTLTVEEISSLRNSNNSTQSRNAFLAYLSACSTVENRVSRLLDENLTIGSALQAAGFAHVIGHLWPAWEFLSADFARCFWKFMAEFGIVGREIGDCEKQNGEEDGLALREEGERRDGLVAFCLWWAIVRTCNQHRCWQEPLFWAGLVHLGP